MNFLLTNDWHLRYGRPIGRTDDFFSAQYNKVVQILDIYKKEKCFSLLHGGDVLDNPKPPSILVSQYIRLLINSGIVINSVLGQHDLSMHSMDSVVRSAIDIFRAAGVLNILGSEPVTIGDMTVYGTSFGQKVVKPTGDRNVLVIHKMIADRSLYPGHEFLKPKQFVRSYGGYELVLCGDYHYQFVEQVGDTLVVNCGALVRKTRSEMDRVLEPAIGIYDTDTKKLRMISLDFAPSNEVFDSTKKVDNSDHEYSVKEFVDRLKSQMNITVSFRDNLRRFFDTQGTPMEVQEFVLSTLEESIKEKKYGA